MWTLINKYLLVVYTIPEHNMCTLQSFTFYPLDNNIIALCTYFWIEWSLQPRSEHVMCCYLSRYA